MAMTKEERAAAGKRGGTLAWEHRRNDPAKMAKWRRAIHLGRLRAMRARKLAAKVKEKPVAKKNGKRTYWMQLDPKRMKAAALKGARARKRNRLAREREQAAKEVQRNVVAHHSPDELVHLEFPLVAGGPTRSTNGGHLGDDLTQLTPAHRKQLALEGLRFVKILLE